MKAEHRALREVMRRNSIALFVGLLAVLPWTASAQSSPLTPRGLQNEIALAELYGYVRYFHPSDEAAHANWDGFVFTCVQEVESAKDAKELAEKLTPLFRAIAPTIRVLPTGEPYRPPEDLRLTTDMVNPRITFWRHVGVGSTSKMTINYNPYHSERVQESAYAADRSKVPTPDLPWRVDLRGGITAWVPLALYVDGQGTLPHAEVTALDSITASQRVWSVTDRATRLADVIVAWNVFEHFYPYFDVFETDWPAVLPGALEKAAEDQNETEFTETLRRLVAQLRDGHGGVHTPASRASLPLRWDWVEDQLVVTVVAESVQGRIVPGDAVIKINGRTAAEVVADKENLVSGATLQWTRYRALQELARGQSGKTAELEVESFREPRHTNKVLLQYEQSSPLEERRPAAIAEIEPRMFYIDIGRTSDEEFDSKLPLLEKAQGIIFDFRGYPSKLSPKFLTHLSDENLNSAQWLIPVVLWPDRHDMQFEHGGEWHLQPSKPLLRARRAFITDGRTISQAESDMGIVEYYKLGTIVGTPTAGTNGNVNSFTLPGGYTITWTGMKVLKQNGSRHHGVGIIPNLAVSRTRAGIAAGRDEFLERAVEAVRQ
jgi:hypothetical protein